jgi:hypothetical protein
MFDLDNLDDTSEAIIINDPNEEELDDYSDESGDDADTEDSDSSTEEVDAEETTGDESADEQVEPEWKTKFKSPEELFSAFKKLEQSYDNIRPEFTRKSQELAELKKKISPDRETTLPTEVKNPEDVVNLIKSAVRIETEQAVAPYKERAEMLEMESALNKLARTHDDFEEYLPSAMEILESKPYLWAGGSEDALMAAYGLAKAGQVNSSVERLVEKTLSDKDKINAIKQKTAANRTKAAPPKTVESTPEDDIAESILAISKSKLNLFL